MDEKRANIILKASGKITHKSLKTLAAAGNTNALQLLSNPAEPIIEDLQQEVVMKLLENADHLIFDDNGQLTEKQQIELSYLGFTFNDYIAERSKAKNACYGIVSKVLYSMVQRHYKREYIAEMRETESGEYIECDIMVTASVRKYRDAQTIRERWETIEAARDHMTKKQLEVLDLRLKDFRPFEIAQILGENKAGISKREKGIRQAIHSVMNN